MSLEDLRKAIESIATENYFGYKGKHGCVEPISSQQFFLVYDGETTEVHSIDDIMNTPFIDGKSLNEVFDELDYVE